jgi:O-antigen/teichoic acid export membrane protein
MVLCVNLNSLRFLKNNTRRVFYWLKLNKQFAFYTTPAAFFNYLAGSAPVFLLAAYFGEREVGLFSMLQRVVMGPVGIISGAVNRVFQRELTKRIYDGEKFFQFFESLSFRLVGLGFLGGFVLLGVTYFNGMSLVFGDKWRDLDAVLVLFVPVCIAAFFSSSLAGFAVIGSNRLGMLFQFSRLLLVGIGFVVGYIFFDDFSLVIMFVSWALTAMFVIQWLAMISILRLRDKSFTSSYLRR